MQSTASQSPTMNDRVHKNPEFLLPFEKMHGLGNDFVIVNYKHLPEEENEALDLDLTKKVCDRHFGVGADGLIVISAVKESEYAMHGWRYYNSDGSIGEMCGNGIRCAAKYLYENGLTQEDTLFKIETLAGDISVEILEDEMVRVGMGNAREIKEKLSLSVDDFSFDYDYVSMGNPHAISFFDLSSEELKEIAKHGPKIEVHSDFPNKTNVEFARMIDPQTIELIVWERGCGFTKACGTGACATVVAAIKRGLAQVDTDITVKLPGGDLIIRVDTVADEIFMTGKAEHSFSGSYIYKL